MSAYVVDDDTINRILAGMQKAKKETDNGGGLNYPELPNSFLFNTGLVGIKDCWYSLGCMLIEMNQNAVNQRYDEKDRAPILLYNKIPAPTPIQLYKSLRCYLYQCSEGDIPNTLLYRMLDKWSDDIAHYIVRHLREFENVEWG